MRIPSTCLRALATAAVLLGAVTVSPVAAASSAIECGQLTGYTAPDGAGPTDGSVQLGLSDSWVILASATIAPAAETGLPPLVNSGPTCLALELDDDGNVTALDFAPSGSLSGQVEFDSGTGFYLFADRLIIPTFVTDAYPGLAVLFVASYQAGTVLSITFTVDPTSGQFTGFDGEAAFCGPGSVTPDGDGQVGDAIIPAAVMEPDDLDALAGAGGRNACASIRSVGTIDSATGDITTTTDVDIVVAAAGVTVTPPPTSTADTVAPASGPGPATIAWLVIAAAGSVLILMRRWGVVARR